MLAAYHFWFSIIIGGHYTILTVIGSTTIDLENRFLSLHRPLCGIPETFSK